MKLRFLLVVMISIGIVSVSVIDAKLVSPTAVSQPVQPQPILPFCTPLRDLPIPPAPIQQMVHRFRMFDRYVAYDLVSQSSYSQYNLIVLDMGPDHRFFTPDDRPLQVVTDTIDAIIPDMDLSNETLVWIQSTPGLPNLELRRCNLSSCESNAPELIFTRDLQHDLENSVTISGSQILWTVHDFINRLSTKVMFCNLNSNNNPGGCLSTDQKQVINLYLGQNEYIHEIKTTENFGYVITTTPVAYPMRMYILDYANLTINQYYDESRDQVQVIEFEPIKLQSGIDMLYMLENGTISTAFIVDGTEIFSSRTRLLSGPNIEALAADRNTNYLFEFSYLERDNRGSNYYLKTFVPFKTYDLDRSTYQQMRHMEYSKNSFVTVNNNGLPAYTYCS